jgi:HAD superfamily hydrolase (TIGR01493 family)
MSEQPITWAMVDLDALVNLDGAVASFLYSIALRSGDDSPAPGGALHAEFVAIREHQALLPFRPWKKVMWESLNVWCEQLGYTWHDAYADALAMTMRSALPFADAAIALRQAQEAGVILALVAESDHDVVCHSLNHLQVGFEEVVISEDAGAYRPRPDIYRRALEQIDVGGETIVHVSPNLARDLAPAREVGLRTALIDRTHPPEENDDRAEWVWSDLRGVREISPDSSA